MYIYSINFFYSKAGGTEHPLSPAFSGVKSLSHRLRHLSVSICCHSV